MTDEELDLVIDLLKDAVLKNRIYANYFTWSIDRDQEELGVVSTLAESLEISNNLNFGNIRLRGRGEDPPDCEAVDSCGERVAIEVTELVDSDAIKASIRNNNPYESADWSKEKFENYVSNLIKRKDYSFNNLKGGPYNGGYIVVLFTDEPSLDKVTVENYLNSVNINKPVHIDKAYLLLSYDPSIKNYPHFEFVFCN